MADQEDQAPPDAQDLEREALLAQHHIDIDPQVATGVLNQLLSIVDRYANEQLPKTLAIREILSAIPSPDRQSAAFTEPFRIFTDMLDTVDAEREAARAAQQDGHVPASPPRPPINAHDGARASRRHGRRRRAESADGSSESEGVDGSGLSDVEDMPWRRGGFVGQADISNELRRTLELSQRYCYRPKRSLRKILALAGLPEVPVKEWQAILKNGYVDYSSIFSFIHTDIQPSNRESVSLGSGFRIEQDHSSISKGSHARLTSGQWIIAHNHASAAVCIAYPGRERELKEYGKHITNKFATTTNDSFVLAYDEHVRRNYSVKNEFTLDQFDKFIELNMSYATPYGVGFGRVIDKGKGGSSSVPSGGSGSRPTKRTKSDSSLEVCRNYNEGKCKRGSSCTRIHICSVSGCGSKHRALDHDSEKESHAKR